jgi:hypothetical protein
MRLAIDYQRDRDFKPQDSIVYALVMQHLPSSPAVKKCFVTTNSKDFVYPAIQSELATYDCLLLTRFGDGLGYIRSQA